MTDLPGCRAHTLPANDDESTQVLPLAFTVNFFGNLYDQLFVNNNGNVSLGHAVSEYTPDGLSAPQHFPTLAPFWADVDTSGPGSGLVTYGNTQYNGDPAFCVLWPQVGYFSSHTDKRNGFQLLVVDRHDTGTDNVDFIFNYDQIRWESGDDSGGSDGLGGQCARAGYTNGTGKAGEHYEVPGSGVCGALLDSNAATGLTQTSLNSGTKGQFVFSVRNGLVGTAGGCLNLASCFSGAGPAGLAVAAAPPPPPTPPPSHFQEEAGSRILEAGGSGLDLGMQSVEERAALEAMADAAVADVGIPGAARAGRDTDHDDDGAPPPAPPA